MAMNQFEKLLQGFEPSFEFVPPKAIPEAEFYSRIEQIRREAMIAELDVTIVNANGASGFNTTNKYLRYLCDWMREGVLIIPTDSSKGLQLYSFYTQSVLLPPSLGEAVGVEKMYQVGALGREYSGRQGDSGRQLVEGVVKSLAHLGYSTANIGLIGDSSSVKHWHGIQSLLPKATYKEMTHVILNMQRIRSKNEVDQIRASAQLMDIGFEAAVHACKPGVTDFELYAAFSFAQLARGGENADAYQIGVNQYGTHCGKPYGHRIVSGDLINFYVSGISFRGYSAQMARMIAVGDITDKQEQTLEVCTEALRRAEKAIRPGARACDINKAAFSAYVEQGYVEDDITATMPYNWAPNDDLSAVEIPEQYVPDVDFEATGRKLMHIYPAVAGPHNPNVGHSVGMHGNPDKFNLTSHNTDICRPGLTFVLHPQWLAPQESGANIGNSYAVTEDGYENLNCHTPIETIRIKA
ncbi:Xaa-Pro peptidase family protein [Vibrio sp. EA2]|uniref:M24 family metallopeptidase n=1 Tax=Vibrio sp. EA2 TaxID=3079860 RepID=UPI00294A4B73|nr:Xaa-Pro peptidase family protein [Vibrio sp. EA2]MDV6250540.1 Xaa-Pro peptidase family protein [Vibrio sp. EA2]